MRRRLSRYLSHLLLGAGLCLPLGCAADQSGTTGPEGGTLEVQTATIGVVLDPDGYILSLDGGANQAIGSNGQVTMTDVLPGDHDLELSDVAPNCDVTSSNPRSVTVSAGETVQVSFQVICTALGGLEVTMRTTGEATDPDGYLISVDGGTPQQIGVTGTVILSGLPQGDHDLEVGDLSPLCGVPGDNPLTVRVVSGSTVPLVVNVVCQGPLRDRIAFGSGLNTIPTAPEDIYVMRDDGSDLLQLTYHPARDRRPAVSPDGSQLVFETDRDGNFEIYAMQANGSGLMNLTNHPDDDFAPTWSPDGTTVAFMRGGDIYVMAADGSSITNLTNSPWRESFPAWSPDGTQIAFNSDRDGAGLPYYRTDIFVMAVDGSNPINLTGNTAYGGLAPAWSSDGSKIAFHMWDIWVMNADGSNLVNLTNSVAGPNKDPSWAPDGRISYSTVSYTPDFEIFVMNGDGTGAVNITNRPSYDDSNGPQAWSP